MKKCHKCDMVFSHKTRVRCLYCDTLLVDVQDDEQAIATELMPVSGALIEQVVKDKGKNLPHQQQQYVIGSYFRMRTFHFLYCFSRNEFRMGKTFKRTLIQPLNITSFLVIPWVIVDLLDSALMRLSYSGYCEKCGWKIVGTQCEPEDCEYQKDYSNLINEILSGSIAETESQLEKDAIQKIREGKKSAYFDLCSNRSSYETFFDVAGVWFSVGLLTYFFIWFTYPVTVGLINALNPTNFTLERSIPDPKHEYLY